MNRDAEKTIRDNLEARKGSGHELDGFTRIEAKVSSKPRAVFSLRIGADELEEIEAAAGAGGQNIGEFIREAALLRARLVTDKRSVIADFSSAYFTTRSALAHLAEVANLAGLPLVQEPDQKAVVRGPFTGSGVINHDLPVQDHRRRRGRT